jgi:ribosomal protein S18 acetylase RimI-like enzyme
MILPFLSLFPSRQSGTTHRGITYFKRFRMEFDLRWHPLPPARLPEGYRLEPYSEGLIAEHALAKYESFHDEIDAAIFPCLGDRDGCRRLMEEISARPGFMPEATWLVEYQDHVGRSEVCATIQGLQDANRFGAIQNVGVTPFHRNRGLGSALVRAALIGFQQRGLTRAYLEVTAHNTGAVQLYQRLGFRRVKTLYKSVETPPDSCSGEPARATF